MSYVHAVNSYLCRLQPNMEAGLPRYPNAMGNCLISMPRNTSMLDNSNVYNTRQKSQPHGKTEKYSHTFLLQKFQQKSRYLTKKLELKSKVNKPRITSVSTSQWTSIPVPNYWPGQGPGAISPRFPRVGEITASRAGTPVLCPVCGAVVVWTPCEWCGCEKCNSSHGWSCYFKNIG